MKRAGKDEIWYWYQMIERALSEPESHAMFCKKNNVDYKKFCNMYRRIVYKKHTNPQEYKKLIALGREYPKSGLTLNKFSQKNNVNTRLISEIRAHLNYLDIIEEFKQEKNGSSTENAMQFIRVPNHLPAKAPEHLPEPELIEKKNDIELTISKGIKVTVSPEVGADKLIRIIELLKDL